MSEPLIIRLSKDTADTEAILNNITHIHASCIHYDKTQVTFLPPLSYSKISKSWTDIHGEVLAGDRHIWVELHPIASRKAQLESPLSDNQLKSISVKQHPDQEYEVAGVVSLFKPFSETGPFRAQVLRLLVSPNHRQKGVAKRLMRALELTALEEGRWNLMLDTEIGSPAESVYPKLGYIRVGTVPQYGYSPVPGKWCDEVWFYKDLRHGTL